MKNLSILPFVLLLSTSSFLINCTNTSNSQDTQAVDSVAMDSTQILQNIKAMYAWSETDTTQLYDFTLAYPKGFCTGIDQKANDNRMAELKETGFFDEAFFENYKQILTKIDTEIKADTAKYQEGDGLENDYFGANPWCNCQDSPDKYWETMKIKDLVINGNVATAKWTWIWNDTNPFSYEVKLKKANNTWKITNLEGFDNLRK